MKKNIVIVGGGIIGLCSAYYLKKAGHSVTIIDKGDMKDGCSFGNAGMIVPSHFIPLAAPGMISKGIRWMFDSKSPFYVRPSLSKDIIRWGYHFYRNANKKKVDRAIPALKDLSIFSKSMYQDLAKQVPFEFGYHERGLLMLYQKKETEAEERETAEIAHRLGMEAKVLSAEEVQALEPDVKVSVRGGVFFPGDAHITPRILMSHLISHVQDLGVVVKTNTTLLGVTTSNHTITGLRTNAGDMSFDEVVLAAGSWSGAIGEMMKLKLPMQGGKGYSFTLQNVKKNIRIPSIFLEARVAVTPMGSDLRFGGTMEIAGVNHDINMNRVKGIVDSIPKYYPEMDVSVPPREQVWHGLRPCSPDGLPFIGRSKELHNLIVATGHSMMGVSLGPGSGMLVKELVEESRPSVDLKLFDPGRYQ